LGFENVQRIYPGIDLEQYRKTEKDADLMKKNNITKTDFVINFTGEYSRLGAIDLVVDSFINIAKIIPEAKLSLAVRIKNEEDAEKKKEVVEKLKENNLLEKISFFDSGEYKMPEVYNLCDISIFPVQNMKGKFDVPLAVVEAMACEKPVIISDLPILQEFTNEENSVRIETGDQKALEEAILDLYKNPENRTKIGRNARAYVEKNFDIKNVAREYEKIYEQI
jgi:glycosyltransferase involved in cell wall biosynthesis